MTLVGGLEKYVNVDNHVHTFLRKYGKTAFHMKVHFKTDLFR
jgi:hypothetical protein